MANNAKMLDYGKTFFVWLQRNGVPVADETELRFLAGTAGISTESTDYTPRMLAMGMENESYLSASAYVDARDEAHAVSVFNWLVEQHRGAL